MKSLNGKKFDNLYRINNNIKQSKKIFQNYEKNKGLVNESKEPIKYTQNPTFINKSNKNNNLNFKNNNKSLPMKINKSIAFPQKKAFNYMKNLNPAHMLFNSGIMGLTNKKKKVMNGNDFRNQENIQKYRKSNKIGKNSTVINYISISNNNNINLVKENSTKKMGLSQINFYNHNNNLNYFPNIHYQRPNLNSINDNWMVYSHQKQFIYNDLMNNMIRNNPQNFRNDNFVQIFDVEYKRPKEKLKKGQNQLILERLQKKYLTQIQAQNMHRTGTGFYPKNNNKDIGKGRQRSAQNNIGDSYEGLVNKNEIISENNIKDKDNKNKFIDKEKAFIDTNNNKVKMFNKTYNGFNLKKKNKEKRNKEKIIFIKLMKYFNKKTKYFWVRFFNKKRKKFESEEKEEEISQKNKSFDNNRNLLYSILIKHKLGTNLMNKRNYAKKNELKYNTDNSEVDEIKEYKKYQKMFKDDLPGHTNMFKAKIYNKEENKNYFSSELEKNSNVNEKEPKFRGIFESDNHNYENNNANESNDQNNNKRCFNFKTTSNFFSKNNINFKSSNNGEETRNTDDKANGKDNEGKKYKDNFDKEKKNKFNIENIINNVIENNKRAAAARSSTSFYNIGSHFMNNHMRSTKTNFYNPKENRGGGFTGTKDSNFTKEQADEGKYYKPNSLKLTLINPLNWRKHEEIWDNLVTLSIGLTDLEKYMIPPNETDILISSYLKMNPRVLNFCPIQKINVSNSKTENNFISLMVDDSIQNPKQEIKKWKEAYKKVIFRWHPDKLFPVLDEIKLKNEQQKNELKKKSSIIINNTNSLYKSIMEILNKILLVKNQNEA